jgi:hypothetical protein
MTRKINFQDNAYLRLVNEPLSTELGFHSADCNWCCSKTLVNDQVEDMKHIHRVLVREPEGKRPLERSRHRWSNNVKMVF